MFQSIKTRTGFTMIELLVTLVILSVVVTTLSFAIIAGMESYELNTDSANLNQAARALVSRMSDEIRRARDVTCSSNRINIFPSSGPDRISYFLSEGTFYCEVATGTQTDTLEVMAPGEDVTATAFEVSLIQDVDTGKAIQANFTLTLKAREGESRSITSSSSVKANM